MKTVLLIAALGILGLVGYLFYYDATQPTIVQLNSVDSSTTNITNEAAKTDEEVRAELIKEGSEHLTALIQNAREEKKERDSANLSKRKPIWVIQLDGFKSDAKDFEAAYQKLTEAGVTNLYIMKQKRKAFYLVKNDDLNRVECEEAMKGELGETLSKAGIKTISIKDLHNDYCGTKDAVPDGEVKVAKMVRVECYSCK